MSHSLKFILELISCITRVHELRFVFVQHTLKKKSSLKSMKSFICARNLKEAI